MNRRWLALRASLRRRSLRATSIAAAGALLFVLALRFVSTTGSKVVADELASMDIEADVAPVRIDTNAATDQLLGGRHDYNVLLVVVDALRADAVPPGRGAGQSFAQTADTPFLNSWLPQTFRFRRAYSQSTCARPSLSRTFRSLEASDDLLHMGIPLGVQAKGLGMVPVAILPPYFRWSEAQHMYAGFERVAIYDKDHQETMIDRVHETFEGLAGRRFFAWVHFYCLHNPIFAGKTTTKADGTVAKRYQRALRWLDQEMQRLMTELARAGLAENTVIIFTADHGENLGEDGRKGHGGTVSEIEVHVPLAVYIPGQVGGDIDTIVGNVDIVPTVLDIAGAPANPTHRGRSLLPILAGADDATVPLYFETWKGETQGVVVGPHKLTRTGSDGRFERFDVTADPMEERDVYDPHGKLDAMLRSAMLRKNPALFGEELESRETRELLVQQLAAVAPEAPAGPDLELLLQLAALSKDAGALAQTKRIFARAKDVRVQLLVLRHLYATDPPHWEAFVAGRLAEIAGSAAEQAFVNGLAAQGQGAFARDAVARRIGGTRNANGKSKR